MKNKNRLIAERYEHSEQYGLHADAAEALIADIQAPESTPEVKALMAAAEATLALAAAVSAQTVRLEVALLGIERNGRKS